MADLVRRRVILTGLPAGNYTAVCLYSGPLELVMDVRDESESVGRMRVRFNRWGKFRYTFVPRKEGDVATYKVKYTIGKHGGVVYVKGHDRMEYDEIVKRAKHKVMRENAQARRFQAETRFTRASQMD